MKGNRYKKSSSIPVLVGPVEQICEHRCIADQCSTCYLEKTYSKCKHDILSITCRHCWLERIKARDPDDCRVTY